MLRTKFDIANCFWQKTWCSVRFSSSDKAARIKSLNYTNKVLYGQVNNSKKHCFISPQVNSNSVQECTDNTQNKKTLSNKQSEMYWMLQHSPAECYQRTDAVYCTTRRIRKSEIIAKNNKLAETATKSLLETDEHTIKRKRSRQPNVPKIQIKNVKSEEKVIDNPKKKRIDKKAIALLVKQLTDFEETIETDQDLMVGINNSERDPNCPPKDLTNFAELLCNLPVNPNPARKELGTNKIIKTGDKEFDDILTIPPFGFSNLNHHKFEGVVGGQRLEIRDMPSVGKVLQATMPEAARRGLRIWKQLKINELGEEGFLELQKYNLSSGSDFHSALQTFFDTKELPDIQLPVAKLWTSVESTLHRIDKQPELVEAPIVHPMLQYKGIVDCVTKVDNQLSVVEWKKSDKPKISIRSTFDAPVQLCAYLGAINADPRYALGDLRSGLVVVAYSSGKPAHAFRLNEEDVKKYWKEWLMRLHTYRVMLRDGTLPDPI